MSTQWIPHPKDSFIQQRLLITSLNKWPQWKNSLNEWVISLLIPYPGAKRTVISQFPSSRPTPPGSPFWSQPHSLLSRAQVAHLPVPWVGATHTSVHCWGERALCWQQWRSCPCVPASDAGAGGGGHEVHHWRTLQVERVSVRMGGSKIKTTGLVVHLPQVWPINPFTQYWQCLLAIDSGWVNWGLPFLSIGPTRVLRGSNKPKEQKLKERRSV